MAQYQVFIQDQFYKTIEANNTGEVLIIIAKDIENGIPSMDYNQPHNIRIVPINNS